MLVAVLAIGTGQMLVGAPAMAAEPTSAGVDLVYDGTAHGTADACAITGAGGDNSPTDGVVCTNDLVKYGWSIAIPTGQAVTATFSQTLPAGVTWQADNLDICATGESWSGTGTISPDGRTITCTITFVAGNSRSIQLPMIASVSAAAPDGTVIQPVLTVTTDSGPHTYTPPPVEVVSRAQVDLIKTMALRTQGNNVYNGQAGAIVRVSVTGGQTGSSNAKGIAQLASPLTFTDVLAGMPAGATLVTPGNCRTTGGPGSAGSAAPGVWNCTQAGPGSPVNITITGADTSGTVNDSVAGEPNSHTVFSGAFDLFIPASSITAPVVGVNQLTSFDPDDIGGNSNFGGGFEPGGAPGDTCANPANNNNCANVALQPATTGGPIGGVKTLQAPDGTPLPFDGSISILTPGQPFRAKITMLNGNGAVQNNLLVCDKFDVTKEVLDPSRSITDVFQTGGGDTLPTAFTVEYSTRPLTSAQLTGSGCGSPGDSVTDGPWFSSVAAAGGADQVTAVRLVFSQPVGDVFFDWYVPMINVDPNAGDTSIDVLGSSADGRSFTDHATATYRVSLNILTLTKLVDGAASASVIAGTTATYTLQPTYSVPGNSTPDPAVLTVVDTLPTCLFNPVLSGAASATWSMAVAPADLGPDGLVCTPDDVSGPTVTFTSLAPLPGNAPVPPISYDVTVSRLVADNVSKTNTAVVSAPGNTQPAGARTASAAVNVRAAAATEIVKSVDDPLVEVAPDQIGFTAQFANTRTTSVGLTRWVDILPFNGDGRGTSFSGTVKLAALQILGASGDVTVEYTSRPSAQLDGDPAQAGTTWCTQAQFGSAGCPAVIGDTTAIRLTVGDLTGGRTGGIHFTMQPAGNAEGDVYQNTVSPGIAAGLAQPIPTSNQVRVDVVASSVGDYVWYDINRDGVQDASENGIANVTVNLLDSSGTVIDTAVTDANGLYRFSSLHSGDYRVVVDQSTLPFASIILPTYDLDDGTTSPDGDSGNFPLAFDTDRDDVDFGYALPVQDSSAGFFSTQASPSALSPGGSVSDQVTFFGDSAGTYTWRLYGPVAAVGGSCTGVDWSTAPLLASGTLVVPGAGTQTTPAVQLNTLGCYTYQGTLALSVLPGAQVSDTRGLVAETVLVQQGVPVVSTVAASGNNRPGATTSDTVTISGLTAPSTYTWTLYGPVAPVGGACDALDWSTAPTDSGTIAVDPATSVYTTPDRTAAGVGCYSYGGSLAATAGTTAVDLAPGVPVETFRISANAPQITTTASTAAADPGDSVTDGVQISGLGSQAVTYSWTLLGPLAANGGSCAGLDWTTAGVWDAGSIAVTGDGTYTTSATVLGGAGCYSYTGSLPATATSDAAVQAAGVPAETVLVAALPPVQPAVTTQASTNAGDPGTSLTDSVVVSGLPAGVTTTYAWTLEGPVAAVGGSCAAVNWAGAPQADAGTITITGNGTFTTPASVLAAVGCYSYTGTLAATAGGPTTPATLAVALAAGDPAETALISPNASGVVTAISDTTTTSGDTVTDAVTVTGLGGATTSYTWTLYGPEAPVAGSCTGVDWTTADTRATATIPVTGDGLYTTPGVTVIAAGCYSYGGVLAATATSTEVTLPAGDPAETTLVTAATTGLSTQATPQTGQPGVTVHDTVIVTGPVPSGTVYSWRLYGPIAAVAGSCVGLDWTGAPLLTSGTVALTGPGTYQTPDVTLASVGCFSYGGTVPATAGTTEALQAPGVAAETILVSANAPTVVTTASDTDGVPGDSFTDSIVITGTGGASTTYAWALRGPVAASAGSCVGLDWSTAPTLASGSLAVTGNGTYTTPASAPAAVGCYSYTGALAATATTDAVALAAGDPAETFQIAAFAPTVVTTASGPATPPGDASDSVVVSGSGGVTTSYDWTLLTAPPTAAGSCAAVDWTTATPVGNGTIPVTGDGTYTTPDVALTVAGCYSYTGALAATATSGAVTLAAGDPAETFLVAPLQPVIATTASTGSAQPGDVVTDSIQITGGGLTASTYTWQLLGPLPAIAGSCTTVDWSAAATFDSGSIAVAAGSGTYTTSGSTIGLPGCYTYAGQLAATPSSAGAQHLPGDPAETVLAVALDPAIDTNASIHNAHPGDTVSDTIDLTGTRGATPVLTWQLLGPVAPIGGSCDAVDWTGATALDQGTITTTGDGTYVTPDTVVTDLGCYTYEVTAATTPTTNLVVHAAGQPDETLLVAAVLGGLAFTGGPGFAGLWAGGAAVVLGLALVLFMYLRRPRGRHAK